MGGFPQHGLGGGLFSYEVLRRLAAVMTVTTVTPSRHYRIVGVICVPSPDHSFFSIKKVRGIVQTLVVQEAIVVGELEVQVSQVLR